MNWHEIKEIPAFLAGGTRTPLSARWMNEIVWKLNAFIRMKAAELSGLTVNVANAGVVIGIDPKKLRDALGVPPGGGGAGWNLRGEWLATATYAINDAVTYSEDDAMADGNVAGGYLAVQPIAAGSAPPGSVEMTDFWHLYAPFSSDRYVLDGRISPTETDRPVLDLNVDGPDWIDEGSVSRTNGQPEILMFENRTNPTAGARISLRVAQVRLLSGQPLNVELREVAVCVDGELKHMLVLGSQPY